MTIHTGQLSLPALRGRLIEYRVGCVHLCPVAGNTVWSHMAGDAP